MRGPLIHIQTLLAVVNQDFNSWRRPFIQPFNRWRGDNGHRSLVIGHWGRNLKLIPDFLAEQHSSLSTTQVSLNFSWIFECCRLFRPRSLSPPRINLKTLRLRPRQKFGLSFRGRIRSLQSLPDLLTGALFLRLSSLPHISCCLHRELAKWPLLPPTYYNNK